MLLASCPEEPKLPDVNLRTILPCFPCIILLASSILFAGEFRYQTTRRLIDQAAAMDDEAVRTKVLQAPLGSRGDELFLWRWVELDPQSAVRALLAANRHEDASKAVAAWAVEDPVAAAQAMARSQKLRDCAPYAKRWPYWIHGPTTEEFVIAPLLRRAPAEAERLAAHFSEQGRDALDDHEQKLAAAKDPVRTLKRAIQEKRLIALPYDLDHTIAREWGRTDFDGMIRFLKEADLKEHQRQYLLRDGLDGLAAHSIEQATATARRYSMNDSDFFLIRAQVSIDDALRWFAEQSFQGEERKWAWYALHRELEREAIPADQAFHALKKHGLWEAANEDFSVAWMEERAAMPAVILPEYPEASGMCDRTGILARFLDDLPKEAFPSLWAAAFHQERSDVLWQSVELDLILAAWTSVAPMAAWRRTNCGGHHFYANATHLIQSEGILVDWFRARPEDVLPRWEQRTISAPHHYDEAGRYGWINLTSRFADEMSGAGDWKNTWQWFLNAMRRGGSTAFQGRRDNLAGWYPPHDLLKIAARHPDEALAIYRKCLPAPASYPELDQELRKVMKNAKIIAVPPGRTD